MAISDSERRRIDVEASELAAQCWCDGSTSGIEFDSRLAAAFARRLSNLMCEFRQECLNRDYYKSLVVRCGTAIGDDGSKSQDVLCAKVPELVEDITQRMRDLELFAANHQLAYQRFATNHNLSQ